MDPNGKRPSGAGRSIVEMLAEHLDQAIAELATVGPEHPARGRLTGMAHAFALSVAIMRNPYDPPLDAVKLEARERWKARQE